MSDQRERLQNALLAIRKLQARVEELERGRHEPVAIIGIGCRFPGQVDSPDAFWTFLRNGADAISQVPAERFDVDAVFDPDIEAPGRTYSRWGGFLANVDQFDPQFFGISPREAAAMDPQQRLLLETCWTALEHAAIPPHSLEGSNTGVFIGITGSDYASISHDAGALTAHTVSGATCAFAAGRLSYTLGLRGPSMALDTACSSSLSAVHLACRALRNGDCTMAVAGGVNLLLTPDVFISASKNRMLSPTGRCHTFDAAADGFVRGEGCGIVVLRPLQDALAAGDTILAVIRGSAMNQDGATSGITVPNPQAQEALIRDALADANVHPSQVGYVEAHGTGTALGDPIEMRALSQVLSAGRTFDAPFFVGSVKANLGHLEAAAGIAGLIKAVLMVQHAEIPLQPHFNNPSPHVPWPEIPVVVPRSHTAWRSTGMRIAGVSSFGASGTNVHVVIEEPPAPSNGVTMPAAGERTEQIVVLSARSESELHQQAARFRTLLESPDSGSEADLAYTAAVGRTHFPHRLALISATRPELAERLDAFIAHQPDEGVVAAEAHAGRRPKIAFLFTGQGAHYVGMARELHATEPLFRRSIEECDEVFRQISDTSLAAILWPSDQRAAEAATLLQQTRYAQPALYAVQYALARLWRSWGVHPSVVLGHSLGEYAAACVAGALAFDEGLRLVAERGRLMESLPAGRMIAVRAPAEVALEYARAYGSSLSVAAYNGPSNTVFSGSPADVEVFAKELAKRGVDFRMLEISQAFHSPAIEPVLDALEVAAAQVHVMPPQVRLISNLTGQLAREDFAQPAYWRQHARQPVLFERSIHTLEELACDAWIEIGPHPVLTTMAQACVATERLRFASLRRGRSASREMLISLAALHCHGVDVDWQSFYAGRARRKVRLPTYPFQRASYWLDKTEIARPLQPERSDAHPLLGRPLRTAGTQRIFEARLSPHAPAFLAHHRVQDKVIVPAVAFAEAMRAAAQAGAAEDVELRDVVLHEALELSADELVLQTVMTRGHGSQRCEVYSLEDASEPARWRLHASATAHPIENQHRSTLQTTFQTAAQPEITGEQHYDALAARGLEFGESFRGVVRVSSTGDTAVAEIWPPTMLDHEARQFRLHPAVVDACLQAVAVLLPAPASDVWLPFGFERMTWGAAASGALWSRVTVRSPQHAQTILADVDVTDAQGRGVLRVEGVALRRVSRSDAQIHNLLYDVAWELKPQPTRASAHVALTALLEPLAQRAAELDHCDDAALLRELRPQLDRACGAIAFAALRELGCFAAEAATTTDNASAIRAQLDARYLPLFNRLLEMVVQDGLVASPDYGAHVATSHVPTPERLLNDFRARYPEFARELALLERCGGALASVMRGQADPLAVLFPGGLLKDATYLYADSPLTREFTQLASEAVRLAVDAQTSTRVRILEIGGGTGGTTARLLPLLDDARTDYVFTDVSPRFTKDAAIRFGARSNFASRVLDASRPGEEQGFVPASFDIVLAANVLHATPDLRATVRNVTNLLAPGGVLVLLEGVAPDRFADLTVGLTEGWWCFADLPLRSYALIDSSRWLELLGECGLEARALSGTDVMAGQAVIVARKPAHAQPAKWLLIDGVDSTAAQLADRLRMGGGLVSAAALPPAPSDPSAYESLINAAMGAAGTVDHVIFMAGHAATEETGRIAECVTAGALALVQALVRSGSNARLWFVTRGVHAVQAGDFVAPAHAPLWGLARTVLLEHPELRCTCIDLDQHFDNSASLHTQLLSDESEQQVALRGADRYVARLVRRSAVRSDALLSGRPYELRLAGAALLDNLIWAATQRRAPGENEIEVEVEATGLAFRDVLNALGQYPEPDVPFGGEFAGVVLRVGAAVTALRAGDRVFGLTTGAFCSHVTVDQRLVCALPRGLSSAQGAALLAFVTAHHALANLARIRPGESVLIHAAAGGVGMAAVQIAQRAGAHVFATAGSETKRAYLRTLGVEHVYDSRSATFADEILRDTEGRGVSVVINSLSGELIASSIRTLTQAGRFVELGKRGIWSRSRFELARPDASYFTVDLAAALRNDQLLIETLLREVATAVCDGALRPLPFTVFPAADVVDAFRYMAHARHMGRIVVTHARSLSVRHDATYLITGGLGGVGLSTARWLVEKGARSVVLVGRNEPSAEGRAAVEALEQEGARVHVVLADVSNPVEVNRLFDSVLAELPPLRGVFHGALRLDDGAIVQLSWQRFRTVFDARVRGAWLLHNRTATLPLDFFVLHSAAGVVLGSPGQANYTAANTFLDGLAAHRRCLGLPALSVQWGIWSTVGRAAELGLGEKAWQSGVGTLSPREAVEALTLVLEQPFAAPAVAVVPIDWPSFLARGPRAEWAFFSNVRDQATLQTSRVTTARPLPSAPQNLRRELEDAAPTRRAVLLTAHVRSQVTRVLGLAADHPVRSDQPLQELGLDSLMAVELRTLLAGGLELDHPLPATLAFDYPSVSAITEYLARELFAEQTAEAGSAAGHVAYGDVAVADISDAEAEQLLLAELETLRPSGGR